MTFHKRPLPDEEYVEKIRRHDRLFRRMRWIWLALFLGLICCLVSFAGLVQRVAADIPNGRSMFNGGLALGGMFGFMFVVTGAQAVLTLKHWIDSRSGYRTERLMLQYYDKLKDKEVSNKPEQPSPTRDDSNDSD